MKITDHEIHQNVGMIADFVLGKLLVPEAATDGTVLTKEQLKKEQDDFTETQVAVRCGLALFAGFLIDVNRMADAQEAIDSELRQIRNALDAIKHK